MQTQRVAEGLRAWCGWKHPWAFLALLASLSSFGAETIADDFESGSLAIGDNPPGAWTLANSYTSMDSFSVTSAAAHRGDGGFQYAEEYVDAGTSAVAALLFQMTPDITGDIFFRGWFRLTQSNDAGSVFFAQLEDPNHVDVCEFAFNFDAIIADPPYSFFVGGFDTVNFWIDPIGPLEDPYGWHLFECDILGVGTATATRQFFWDGVQRASRTVDLSGFTVGWVTVGEPYGDARFAGAMQFDDVRTSRARPATWLSLTSPASAVARDCVPVDVTLTDANRDPAAAPYDVVAALEAGGAPGAFYGPECNAALTTVTLAAGSTSSRIYFRADGAGTASLGARQIDFLSAPPAQVAVSWFDPPRYVVGCGCDTSGGLWLLSALLLLRRASSAR